MAASAALIVFLAYPMLSHASYLIELTNGNKFITYEPWEEGDEIKFYYYGGVIGIPKSIIKEIRESDLPYKEQLPEEKSSVTEKDVRDETAKKQEDEAEDQPVDDSAYKNRRESLRKQIEEATNKYNAALKQNDQKEITETYQTVAKLSSELKSLKKEVKDRHKGKLPEWWQ